MVYLVNGMDVVKSPDLMGGKEYKGHIKNQRHQLGDVAAGADVL